MIDLGWTELFFLAVVLIVVVGPKDLPGVLKGIGQVVRKIRSLADEFRRGVDEFIRESELEEMNDGVERVRNFNLDQIKAEGRQRNRGNTAAGDNSGTAADSAQDSAENAGEATSSDQPDTPDNAGPEETPKTTSAEASPEDPPAKTDSDSKKEE